MSRIGTANNRNGTAKLAMRSIGFGSNRIVKEATRIPKNRAPASPIYIRAGGLFQSRKPSVAPARTIDKAAIRNCPPCQERRNKKIADIATAPEAPPSILSKKLIEFVIPTIHKTVIGMSIK